MPFARPLALATIGLLTALPAGAQSTITGIRTINEEIDDRQRDTEIDIARGEDPDRFGPAETREGLSGSLSFSLSNSDGSTEERDISFGARLTSKQGSLVQTLGFLLSFSEEDDVDTEEDIFAIYDLTYDWSTNAYAFVLGRLSSDGLADEADEVSLDGFLGIGPGYRVINRPDMTWRAQAGVGASYLEYGDGANETEPGVILASRFYVQLNENAFLTNDTDVLYSDTALRASNDFGVNLRVSDAILTRLSYVTEYNDTRAIRTDNKLAISLVYGF
jgi:putative salt-induced outer membrane protein